MAEPLTITAQAADPQRIAVGRAFIGALLVLLLSLCLSAIGHAANRGAMAVPPSTAKISTSKRAQPNIILIVADDLGFGDLGVFGHPRIKTPNLDRLAAQGKIIANFYVNNPVCSPSRAAMMSGRFPARDRIHGHFSFRAANEKRGMGSWLDPNGPLLTRTLKDAGYATAHFGKWHLGHGTGAPGLEAYGIDRHRSWVSNSPAFGIEDDPYFMARSTAAAVDETINFVSEARDRPFFVNLWTFVPHATLHPTPEQMAPYDSLTPRDSLYRGDDFVQPQMPYDGALKIYYASVTNLDTEIGRLMNVLEERGLADNTIVIFTSDNGPEDINLPSASHSAAGSTGLFRGRKRSLYEGGIRVPFIVRWPSHVPAGTVDNETIFSGIDLLPTIAAITGADLQDRGDIDGEAMIGVFSGEPQKRSRPLFWDWRYEIIGEPINRSPQIAIRHENWKLLMNPDGSRVELYDLSKDPMEVDNRAESNKQTVKKMSRMLLNWYRELPPGPVDPSAGTQGIRYPALAPTR